jgi:DNA-binding Lrp family transcriptional regulator
MCTNLARIQRLEHEMRIDDVDIRLLDALQADGRLTNFDLADRVGLSASQCSRRRAALEDAGVIESYHACLSPETLGLGVLVFVQVTLATHSPDHSKRFQKLIDELPEVQEAYSLTGEADYLIKLIVTDPQGAVENLERGVPTARKRGARPFLDRSRQFEADKPAAACASRIQEA